MKNIAVNMKYLTKGSITIFYDNKKVVKAISEGFLKASEGIQDKVLLIGAIIEILNNIIIKIYLEFKEWHPKIKQDETFQSHPGKNFIIECNNKARAAR